MKTVSDSHDAEDTQAVQDPDPTSASAVRTRTSNWPRRPRFRRATARLPRTFSREAHGVDTRLRDGRRRNGESVLTRLHSECLTGDVLGSYRCDCGEQLDLALRYIAAEGRGILLYLRGHEGRGIGLRTRFARTRCRSRGSIPSRRTCTSASPTTPANTIPPPDTARAEREIGAADEQQSVEVRYAVKHDIPVCERVALAIPMREENERYIRTKQALGHYFDENE